MALREDLVSSAVTFLQDPSVANASLDKRIAFLQSKNLTQEEIDASLARAGDANIAPGPAPTGYGSQQLAARPPAQPYGYGQYQAYWQQPPPPDLPRRDWRDYFIMATVMSGLSYGIYFVAKRYIVPIIAPPTPPQLEQDKTAVDESFSRAFTLIEQLSTDTASIKASEEARKERLDSALSEVESVTEELKIASRRRDDDTRKISDEVRALQNMIPKAMKAQEDSTDARLRELNTELKSLKTLIANRMSTGGAAAIGGQPPKPSLPVNSAGANMFGPQGMPSVIGASGTQTPPSSEAAAISTGSTATQDGLPNGSSASAASAQSTPSYNRLGGGRGGIPAWQLAAAKKVEQEDTAKKDTADSGTVTDVNGASVISAS